jgi:hypothetical protein
MSKIEKTKRPDNENTIAPADHYSLPNRLGVRFRKSSEPPLLECSACRGRDVYELEGKALLTQRESKTQRPH